MLLHAKILIIPQYTTYGFVFSPLNAPFFPAGVYNRLQLRYPLSPNLGKLLIS